MSDSASGPSKQELLPRGTALYSLGIAAFAAIFAVGPTIYDNHTLIGGAFTVIGAIGLLVIALLLVRYSLKVHHFLIGIIITLVVGWAITGYVLWPHANQTPQHVGFGGGGAQYAPGTGSGGKGGDVLMKGDRNNGGGGNGGLGSVDCVGGTGGNVEIQGEGSSGVGGAGGNCFTPDGRGGRRTVSPTESADLPTELWAYGYGGQGGNKPEYDRRLKLLKQIRDEYVKKFPAEIPFIEAGVDPVPIHWVNKRLEELGQKWRVTLVDGGYVMPPLSNR